jgi:methylthioribose-1-phosphate isomerase
MCPRRDSGDITQQKYSRSLYHYGGGGSRSDYGDAANKIGTYSLAIIAQAHNVPFFVAAPPSTIDFSLADGSLIEIEERDPKEVSNVGATVICPPGVEFFNPAFDVTPARLIAGIITEFGTFAPGDLGQIQGKK